MLRDIRMTTNKPKNALSMASSKESLPPGHGPPPQEPGPNDSGPSETRHQVRHVLAGMDQQGQRIDNFLMSQLKTVPRGLVYRLLRTGQVRVNKGRVKPGFRLSEGDSVRIPPVTVSELQEIRVPSSVVSEIRESIIAEDEQWIVINKPAGLSVHAGSGVSFGVIDAIKLVFDDPAISLVHRLDKATSGVMVLAKNRLASVHFQQALADGRVHKRYVAVLCGNLKKSRTVTARLRKTHPTPNENRVIVDPKSGKTALTRINCNRRGKGFTLADIEIETGRTHQIRVHAASVGHPVLGDERYGDASINQAAKQRGYQRMYLHASEICIVEPDSSNAIDEDSLVERKFVALPDDSWLGIFS